MRIANNVPALMTHLNMRRNDRVMSAAMQRLSSGLRINSAREDAAGLAIATKLSYQVTGLERASSNSTHGISMIQTAEGALNEIHNMLQRMRELAVQSANDAVTMEDRAKIQQELNELTDEISAAAARAEFNQIKLLNGEAARVNTNWHAGRVNAVIAAATFISENVPSGTLHYTIHRVGLPAEVVGSSPIQFDHTFRDRIRPAEARLDFSSPIVDGNNTLLINEYVFNLRDGDDLMAVLRRAIEGPPPGVVSGSEVDPLYRGVERMSGLEVVPDWDLGPFITLRTTEDNPHRAINIFSDEPNLLLNNLGLDADSVEEANSGIAQPARLSGNIHAFFAADTSVENPQVPDNAAGTFTLTLPDGTERSVVVTAGQLVTDVIAAINAIDLTDTGVRRLETGARSFSFETINTGRDLRLEMSTDNPVLTNMLGLFPGVSAGTSGTGARFNDVGNDGTGRITINGIQIDISANDTYNTVKARIIEASYAGGFLFQEVLLDPTATGGTAFAPNPGHSPWMPSWIVSGNNIIAAQPGHPYMLLDTANAAVLAALNSWAQTQTVLPGGFNPPGTANYANFAEWRANRIGDPGTTSTVVTPTYPSTMAAIDSTTQSGGRTLEQVFNEFFAGHPRNYPTVGAALASSVESTVGGVNTTLEDVFAAHFAANPGDIPAQYAGASDPLLAWVASIGRPDALQIISNEVGPPLSTQLDEWSQNYPGSVAVDFDDWNFRHVGPELLPGGATDIRERLNQFGMPIPDNALATIVNQIPLPIRNALIAELNTWSAGHPGNGNTFAAWLPQNIGPAGMAEVPNPQPPGTWPNLDAALLGGAGLAPEPGLTAALDAIPDELLYAPNLDGERTVLLTSAIAGSAQRIEVEGDPWILDFFGLQPSYSRGIDAEVTASMVDRRGNYLRDFNAALAITADGNQVTFVSSQGNTIHKNIQVRQNPNSASVRQPRPIMDYSTGVEQPFSPPRFEALPRYFTHGDGTTPVADHMPGDPPGTGTPTVTVMELRIENFGPIKLQIGPNFNMNMDVNIPRVNAETLRLAEHKGGAMHRLVNVMTHESAERAITQVNNAINMVSQIRSRLGAYQNRLEATVRNLDTSALNTSSARSRIQDTDMAREMTNYSQRNVMFQAGIAILGQANQRPQMVLQLLN